MKYYKNVIWLIRLAPIFSLIKLLLTLLFSIAVPLNFYFLTQLIDTLCYDINNTSTILFWFVLLVISVLITALSEPIELLQKTIFQKKITNKITSLIVDKFYALEYVDYEDVNTNNIINKLGVAPQEKIVDVYNQVFSTISCVCTIVGNLILFIFVSWWSILLLAFILVMLIICSRYSMKLMNEMFNNQSNNERKMHYIESVFKNKDSLSELRVFGAVNYFIKKWRFVLEEVLKDRLSTTMKAQRVYTINIFLMIIWVVSVVLGLVYFLVNELISVGMFVSLFSVTFSLLSLEDSLSSMITNLSEKILIVKYVREFFQLPERKKIVSNKYINKDKILIKFQNVSFCYPNTDKMVLDNVSFEIDSQEKVAFVGKNGAGKSTIINLLCKLYKPIKGQILINDVNINDIDYEELKLIYGVVFQDFNKFWLTVRENVALCNLENIDDTDKILTILSELRLGDIDINSQLGKFYDNSLEISSGQWQKIAIARSVFSDAPFIILDEPTASLDPFAETEMYNAFMLAMKNRGCLIISHRLASAKLADKIYVIDNGKIVGQGQHNLLLKECKLYNEMWQKQSSWYAIKENKGV